MMVNTGVTYPKEPKTPGSTYFNPRYQKTKANPEENIPIYRIQAQMENEKFKLRGILKIRTKNKSIISPNKMAPVALISPEYLETIFLPKTV